MTSANDNQCHSAEQWLQSRPGERFCIRVPATQTDGKYSVTEVVASSGDSTPAHIHQNEDEHFHMLEGTLHLRYGDETLQLTEGKTFSARRGIPHAWGNATDAPIRMLITLTPGGCEEALREIAILGSAADLMSISGRFNVSVVGPPILG